MIPPTAFDRLVQLGKRPGSLTVSKLGRVLPVDTMTVEEITEVVARLEGAGILVEIDAEFEASHPRKTPSNSEAMPKQASLSAAKTTDHARLEALASSIKAKESQTRARQHLGIEKSGTEFVVAAAVILIVLMLIAWGFGGA